VLALAALVGCSPKRISDIGSNPTPKPLAARSSLTLPFGVKIPPGREGQLNVDGLYPSTIPNDRDCCWLAGRARVLTFKPEGVGRLDASIYVPNYSFFTSHKQGVALSIARAPVERRCCFGPGVYTLTFSLPPKIRARRGDVALDFSTTYDFVPRRERINGDNRRLGVVLLRVDYRR